MTDFAIHDALPHECPYEAGTCRLPGIHGGVPDPDPANARPESFTVSADRDGDMELRCDHYGLGCWWTADLKQGERLDDLMVMARAHLAEDHRGVIDGILADDRPALNA